MKTERVLLKVSGEALSGASGFGLDFDAIRLVAGECLQANAMGVKTAVVVGGGNFLRGQELVGSGVDRVAADQMGMLATVMNGLALRAACEGLGGRALVMSAVPVQCGIELFDRRSCLEQLNAGSLVILVGGTGNPFFSTDTAAALRASEIGADLFLKATKVDGVYDEDPEKKPGARRFDKLTYMEVMRKKLGVMDLTAVTLCMENKIPIVVFDLMKEGNVSRVLSGEHVGTKIF